MSLSFNGQQFVPQQVCRDVFQGVAPVPPKEKAMFYECYAILDPKHEWEKSRVLIEHYVEFYHSRADAENDLKCDAYDLLKAEFNLFSARKKLQRVRYVVRAITNG